MNRASEERLTRGAIAASFAVTIISISALFFLNSSFGSDFEDLRPLFAIMLFGFSPFIWVCYYVSIWAWTGRRAIYTLSGFPLVLTVFPLAFLLGALTVEDAIEKAFGVKVNGSGSLLLAVGCGVAGSALAWVLSRALFAHRPTE
jgi:hypothetical protein